MTTSSAHCPTTGVGESGNGNIENSENTDWITACFFGLIVAIVMTVGWVTVLAYINNAKMVIEDIRNWMGGNGGDDRIVIYTVRTINDEQYLDVEILQIEERN